MLLCALSLFLIFYYSQERTLCNESDCKDAFLSENEDLTINQWYMFSDLIQRKYKAAIKTPGSKFLKRIFINAQLIRYEIERDQSCENISALYRYIYVFEEEQWKIDRYIACYNVPNPGAKNLRIRACVEKRLSMFAEASDKLLDEVLGYNWELVEAGDCLIEHILSDLDDGLKPDRS